jgi:aldehyde dehydrogenase (NAD+)
MITRDSLFVGGHWVTPSTTATIDVISPSTEEIVARVPAPVEADVDRAVGAARRALDAGPWRDTVAKERAQVLRAIADGLEARADELAELITTENGTPISISRSAQVLGALPHLRAYADLVEEFPFAETRQGLRVRSAILREPVGVVAAIAPWNGPLVLTLMKLAPALAAGCTVVAKPSPETPLNAYVLAEACVEAGLPEGVVSILPADRDIGRYLVGHRGVDKVAFTGSSAVGRWILEACAPTMKRVTLELGGKSAAIMLDDVDPVEAITRMLPMATLLSGQICLMQSRLLVPRRQAGELTDALCTAISRLKLGDPFDPDTYFGPLISRRQRERVEEYIASGREEGATVALGGGRPASMAKGWYVEPTVFVGVDNAMRIAREEIFGPVISVIEYDDVDEALAIANDSPYGLAGAVYTTDPERGFDVARRVRTGTFGVNAYGTDPLVPFGGVKESGIGREGGAEGLAAYLETKAVALPDGFDPVP